MLHCRRNGYLNEKLETEKGEVQGHFESNLDTDGSGSEDTYMGICRDMRLVIINPVCLISNKLHSLQWLRSCVLAQHLNLLLKSNG